MKRTKRKTSFTSMEYWLVKNELDYIKKSTEYELALLIGRMIDEKIRQADTGCSCTHNECACM